MDITVNSFCLDHWLPV